MFRIALVVAAAAVAACTAVDVKPVDQSLNLRHVCIEYNSRVQVEDFLSVLQAGFDRHGITSEVVFGDAAQRCEYVLYYTALRSWDFSAYLSHAELRLRRNRHLVASADYHLRGKGGFSVTKWAGTESKIGPVVDELLGGYAAGEPVADDSAEMIPDDIFDRIIALEEQRRSGQITDAEFEAAKQEVLEQM